MQMNHMWTKGSCCCPDNISVSPSVGKPRLRTSKRHFCSDDTHCRRVTFRLPPFRKQHQRACGRAGAARGSPSSWGFGRRTPIRPQESPRRKIQPHPRLSGRHLPPSSFTHLRPRFLQRTPSPFVCTTEILFGVRKTAVSSTSRSALFWYLFLKKLFVLFLLFVLMEALYVSSCSIFYLLRAE